MNKQIKKIMQAFMISCRKASELMEKKHFVGLNLFEKVSLSVHTSMCDACKNYQDQNDLMEDTLKDHLKNAHPKNLSEEVEMPESLKSSISKKIQNLK